MRAWKRAGFQVDRLSSDGGRNGWLCTSGSVHTATPGFSTDWRRSCSTRQAQIKNFAAIFVHKAVEKNVTL